MTELQDPGTLLLAWVLVPAALAVVCAGLGALVGRLSGLRLGLLTVPTGYLAGVVLVVLLLRAGLSGVPAALVCVAAAVPGVVLLVLDLRAAGNRRPGGGSLWAAGAGLVAYLVTLAPVAGSGRSGVAGFVLNNDSGVHLSVIELLRDFGMTAPPDLAPSSYQAVASLTTGGYPLGSHGWVLVGAVLGGVDAFHVWAPVLALTSAMAALVLAWLLRAAGIGARASAVGGALLALGYLPFSYAAQGGLKEVAMLPAIYGTVALIVAGVSAARPWRAAIAPILAAIAAAAIYGGAAGAWLGPLAVAGVLLVLPRLRGRPRPSRRTAALAVAGLLVALAAAVPVVAEGIDYIERNRVVFANDLQVGNLLAPVPFWEAFNVWFSPDYRFPVPAELGLTVLAIAIALPLAVLGAIAAIRERRVPIVLALVAGLAGVLLVAWQTPAIYFRAKALVVLAPALGLATITGLWWLYRRSVRAELLAAGLAVLLGAGVLVSAGWVYGGALITPEERFAELGRLDERIGGRGPVLVHDREYYAKLILRDAEPWNSWDDWQPDRGFRAGPVPKAVPYTPDLDDYTPGFYDRFRWIVERRRPGGSLPPGSFRLVETTRHYRLWRRSGPVPQQRLELGDDRLGGAGRLDCGDSRTRSFLETARRSGATIRVSRAAPAPVLAESVGWDPLDAETEAGPAKGFIRRQGGNGYAYTKLPPGRYDAWIQGSFGPGVRMYLGSEPVGEIVGDAEVFSAWHPLGTVDVVRPKPIFRLLGLDRPWWQSGSDVKDVTGPVAFTRSDAAPRIERVDARAASRLCGERLDWLELG